MVKTRDHGAKVELIGQRPDVESGAMRPEVKLGDYHTKAELETGRPKVDPNHSVGPSRDRTKELAEEEREGDFQLSDEGDLELNGTSRDAGDSELGGTNEDTGELRWMEPGKEVWFGNMRELHCLCSWAETVQ